MTTAEILEYGTAITTVYNAFLHSSVRTAVAGLKAEIAEKFVSKDDLKTLLSFKGEQK